MPTAWTWSLIAVSIVSLVSLVGAIILVLSEVQLRRTLLFLVSLSAGALLGDALLHLLPDAYGNAPVSGAVAALGGILGMFVLEKLLHWRHSHRPNAPEAFGYMNLAADALHNLIDGALVAASFSVSWDMGITTTLAVIMHEVPQEIGDFGVLLHSGFRPLQAVLVNLVSGMVAIAGALLFLFISKHYALSVDILAGATAGAFLYVAGADLIPELHDANRPWQSIVQLLGLCIGMAIMGTLLRLE